MNLIPNNIDEQLDELLREYPLLSVNEKNGKRISVTGKIQIHRSVNDYPVRKTYQISIIVLLGSDEMPSISEDEGAVSSDYVHKYEDGKLCLETEVAIRIRFVDGFNLLQWVVEFVEPFFVTYEYYASFGVYPNGERSHGSMGIIETYKEIFHTDDTISTFKGIRLICEGEWRGHAPCFCGSEKYLRKCHGKWILQFLNDSRMKNIVQRDYNTMKAEIDEYRRFTKEAE